MNRLPNAYITREGVFVDGIKLPGILNAEIVIFPGQDYNMLKIEFKVSNTVVEGFDD